MSRILAVLFAAILMTVSLSSCGKKGEPKPPDKNSTYPEQYPKPRS